MTGGGGFGGGQNNNSKRLNQGDASFYSSLYFPKIETDYMLSTFNGAFPAQKEEEEA